MKRRPALNHLDEGLGQALHEDPGRHDEGRERVEHAGALGPGEAGEGEEAIVGASRDDTAVGAAAVQDAPTLRRLLGLDRRGMSRSRKVDIATELPIVVVKPRDVGAHPVHRRHVEGRRRRRQPDSHRLEPVVIPLEQAGQKGHAPRRERLVEHRAREAIDLHDEERPTRGRRCGATAQAADQAIDGVLGGESQLVEGYRALRRERRIAPTRSRIASGACPNLAAPCPPRARPGSHCPLVRS